MNLPLPALCSISLYLFASISPYLCAYLRAYCSRISTQRPLRIYTSHTLPPPLFRSVKILVAFLQFFFEIFFCDFFWKFFFAEFHKVLFFPQGSFLWLWVFLRECIFRVKHFGRERFFFFARVVFSEIVQF